MAQLSVRDTSNDDKTVMRWVNQALSTGGYADIVTDLAADMGDGITLLKLVQTLDKEGFPKHSAAPIMKARKLKNLQLCLKFLQERHIPIGRVRAEELLAGNMESIMLICNALRTHYSSTHNNRVQRSLVYSTLEKEDMEVFAWVGKLLDKDIQSYSTFYDGTIVCEVLNHIHEGAIPDTELQKATNSEVKLKLAEAAARKYLSIVSPLDPLLVHDGGQDNNLRLFLQQCKERHLRRGAGASKYLSGQGGRETSHITARSYESIHRRKHEGQHVSHDQHPGSLAKKKHADLYIHGASSFTDLSSRRAEHESMITRGGSAGTSMSKYTSSSSESLDQNLFAPFGGGLDRVQSMESGIAEQQPKTWKGHRTEHSSTLPRSASQGSLPPPLPSLPPPRPLPAKSLARSTENFHTQIFGLASARRTPSYVHLDSAGSEELAEQVAALEERIGVLAMRFLYERQDMFKQILRALMKERKKRVLAERRIETLESSSRQLVQHYDARFVELARQVSILRSEVTIHKGGSTADTITMEIEQLKEQLSSLIKTQDSTSKDQLPLASPDVHNTLFLRKRRGSAVTSKSPPSAVATTLHTTVFSKGSSASYKKLSRFFGEAPPRVEDLESLLEALGYTHLLPTLRTHNISLAELRTLTEEHLEAIGVPLGARVRLLEEVKDLVPIEDGRKI